MTVSPFGTQRPPICSPPIRTAGQSTYAADQMLAGNGDVAIPGVTIGQVCMSDNCATLSDIHNNNEGNSALMNTNVRRFFNPQNRNLLYYWARTDANTKLIHKGDLIRYRRGNVDTHISTVHSDGSTCTTSGTGMPNDQIACTYDSIHAFSWECSNSSASQCRRNPWFRKVGVTTNTHPGLSTPTGFGRIKLWD